MNFCVRSSRLISGSLRSGPSMPSLRRVFYRPTDHSNCHTHGPSMPSLCHVYTIDHSHCDYTQAHARINTCTHGPSIPSLSTTCLHRPTDHSCTHVHLRVRVCTMYTRTLIHLRGLFTTATICPHSHTTHKGLLIIEHVRHMRLAYPM